MDYDQTRISCNNNGEYFDIKKSQYSITATLTNEQKNTIASEICGVTNIQITEDDNKTFLSSNNVFVASKGVTIEKLDILKFSGYLVGTILVLLAITEILRRTIYYIFLGSLKPKK